MNQPKRIAILGATGSIGVQALDVVRAHPQLWQVEVLTARRSSELLIKQAVEFLPNAVVVVEEGAYREVQRALEPYPVKVYMGRQSLLEVLAWDSVDLVLNALVGFAGLEPTLAALSHGKAVALANKESLVAGGHLVMQAVWDHRVPLLPVDSEHSAIFQCLQGEQATVEKIWLTASGGPFFHLSSDLLAQITPQQALKHPTWDMGPKVTIDSATLMNKGFEVIEAMWLFGLDRSQVEVVIHPQSLVHSMVQFTDGSVKAQLSCPNMRLPIQYALSYPQRLDFAQAKRMTVSDLCSMRFYEPPMERFPCLSLAYRAMERGGNIPCAMNASNEAAVAAFLNREIPFPAIPKVIEEVTERISIINKPSINQLLETNLEAYSMAQILLKKYSYGSAD